MNNTTFSDAGGKHSNYSCMATSDVTTECRIVSDMQATVGGQPSCITTSCREHLSRHHNVQEMSVYDQQVMQSPENTAFPDTSRRTSVEMDGESRMLTEVSTSPFLLTVAFNGKNRVSRPLCSRLWRHRKCLSNKESKRISPKKRYSNQQNYCINNSNVQKYQERIEAEVKKDSESMYRYGRTCLEAINCIERVSHEMQNKIAKYGSGEKLGARWTNPSPETSANQNAEIATRIHRKFSLQIGREHVCQHRHLTARLNG